MNAVCPNEDGLKSLIMEAFDELPAADPVRIQGIATTLANKAKKQGNLRHRPRHHWLFWLLLGGSMTAAAWWAETKFGQPEPLPVVIKTEPAAIAPVIKAPVANDKKLHKPADADGSKKDNHVIYQREIY